MNQSSSYNNPAARQDLSDIITNLSPKETQFSSGLKKTKATSVNHEFLTDTDLVTTNTSADKKEIEGANFRDDNIVNPVRKVNYTQIISQAFKVTGTEQATTHAGMKNPYTYHEAKAMVAYKHKLEWSVLFGVKNAGSATVAREMSGAFDAITTNRVDAAGAPLTEELLNNYLQMAWEKSSSPVDEVYVGIALKRRISGFTAGSTKNVEAKDKRLVNAVDVYESDMGIVKIFPHRLINSVLAAPGTHNMLMISSQTWKLAELRAPKTYTAAKVGDADKGVIIGEVTLEFLSEESNVAVKNLK